MPLDYYGVFFTTYILDVVSSFIIINVVAMATSSKQNLPYGSKKFSSIDEYHAAFEEGVQERLEQLRSAIRQAAPGATETISYNMPAFKMQKVLVYYAAYKNHIGFYPTPAPLLFYKDELAGYVVSKGAVQFPLNQKLPLTLIKKMVQFRVKEVMAKDVSAKARGRQ